MARATNYVYVPGKLFWVRSIQPETFGDESFWSVTVYPTPDGMKEIKKLKEHPAIMNVLKRDEDGDYIKFKRPCQKRWGGQVRAFTPPLILDKDGKPLTDVLVGNGSDGVVKLEVYQFSKPRVGRAARWESLRVDNLIPYEPNKDMMDNQQAQVAGLDKVPTLPSF